MNVMLYYYFDRKGRPLCVVPAIKNKINYLCSLQKRINNRHTTATNRHDSIGYTRDRRDDGSLKRELLCKMQIGKRQPSIRYLDWISLGHKGRRNKKNIKLVVHQIPLAIKFAILAVATIDG